MDIIRKWMLGNVDILDTKALERKNMIWNMIGSFVYAMASVVLTSVVNHLVGPEQGGIFGFAFSTFGQQMFIVAYFGIRPFHVTDVNGSYSFGDYLALRFVTCASGILIGLGYIMLFGNSKEKSLIIILMVCYKVIDGFADVYESEFQRNGRLYLTGKSNTFRTLLSVVSFLVVLGVTKYLVFSCFIAVIAQIVGVLLLNIPIIKVLPNIQWKAVKGHCISLVKNCSLLFASAFLDLYIFAAAKYAIENQMTNTDNAIYNAIFLPTSVINLATNFVIRPFLTELSYKWEQKQLKEFKYRIIKIFSIILLLTVIAVSGAYFLGVPVLGAISNVDLSSYKTGLLYIIIGGGFFAILNLFYYVLVIMKQQKFIFWVYLPVVVIAAIISPIFVSIGGINGGAISYLLLMIIVAISFSSIVAFFYVKEAKDNG